MENKKVLFPQLDTIVRLFLGNIPECKVPTNDKEDKQLLALWRKYVDDEGQDPGLKFWNYREGDGIPDEHHDDDMVYGLVVNMPVRPSRNLKIDEERRLKFDRELQDFFHRRSKKYFSGVMNEKLKVCFAKQK